MVVWGQVEPAKPSRTAPEPAAAAAGLPHGLHPVQPEVAVGPGAVTGACALGARSSVAGRALS